MLRYEPPISTIVVAATEDLDVGGAPLAEGEYLITSLQGPNRTRANSARPTSLTSPGTPTRT